MPEITINVDVYCTCGEGLCNLTNVRTMRGEDSFVVEPCPKCIERAELRGYNEGYEAGVIDAEKEAKNA